MRNYYSQFGLGVLTGLDVPNETVGYIPGKLDSVGNTLVAASTVEKEIAGQLGELDKKGAAKLVGKVVAQRAKAKGIDNVVFDRGGYIYTGRVAELAAGAREGGLDF